MKEFIAKFGDQINGAGTEQEFRRYKQGNRFITSNLSITGVL